MAILIDKKTRVLIQGITGAEGSRACREMLEYGTKVLAGVTPGKGGQVVDGVPVYDTVAQALKKHKQINVTLVAVPGVFVKDAVLEAIASKIPLINILSEHVPVEDCAFIYAVAKKAGVMVIGPSSIGIISPGLAKIGVIGRSGVKDIFKKGSIGIVSKSGGIIAEISTILTRAGIGQSTAVGIGGDPIACSDFVDILKLFNKDKNTKAIVLFGEIGGTYEELAADYIHPKKFSKGKLRGVKKERFKKPVVAIIAGKFSEILPKGTALGHAGAIVSEGRGSYSSKISALKSAGVKIAETVEEIPLILKMMLK